MTIGIKRSDDVKKRISLSLKGRIFSDAHKKNLSKSRKGIKFSKETKLKMSLAKIGKVTWLTGRKRSEESKLKQSIKCRLRVGSKNPAWKGGINPINHSIRNSIEYEIWRSAVFASQNYTCQKYGTRGGILHAHHIQNFAQYPELRFAIDNGCTLSEKAHVEFHKKYGKINNTKDQLLEFLNNKLDGK